MTGNGHPDLEALSAFHDGDLGAVDAARLERHLHACAACRAALERVRRLLAEARVLPRDVAPPEHAWAGVQTRIAREGRAAPAPVRAAHWWHNGWLAAAAALVLVAGTALAVRGIGGGAGGGAPFARVAGSGASVGLPAVRAVEDNYTATLVDLRRTLDDQRATLAPHTVRVVEHSLAVIDTAIAEARAALAADPGSTVLIQILAAQYARKVDLLQRATRLSPSL
jgi:hypothetical protein